MVDTSTDDNRLRQRLQTALVAAMRVRDATAVAALRSALGAIANAEAVEGEAAAPIGESPIAHAVSGLGAGDVARRELSDADQIAVVRNEIAERETAALGYDRLGRSDEAERLRSEANFLREQLR